MPRIKKKTAKSILMKTHLSEGQHAVAIETMEAKGLTQAGYLRHLILQDCAACEDLVRQIKRLTSSD